MISNKSWCVRVFKCLDHDQMIGSRICMSKVIDQGDMLLPAVRFVLTWCMTRKLQKTWFLVFSYFKLCRSTSTEWILYLNVVALSLSGNDSYSNPFKSNQVSLSLSMYIFQGNWLAHITLIIPKLNSVFESSGNWTWNLPR